MDDTIQPAQTPVIRLIFEYEGDQVRLVSQTPVNLSITGFDLARTQRPGYYIDTRDAAGQTLARVPARNLFSTSTEVFPEQPGDLISRVEVATPRGAFTVVVPAGNGANSVSVVRVAPGVAGVAPDGATSATIAGVTTTDIATFALQVSR